MKVVSVINHKGGVGKTTLTANLGAGLAARGKRVLLVDLDSQASLTVSLVKETEWRDSILPTRTIKHWFDGLGSGTEMKRLSRLISSPRGVIPILAPTGGYLDLIAAHRELTETDGELEHLVRGNPSAWVTAHHRLQEGLRQPDLAEYDVVLIDCAPHFGPLARNAVLASDLLLVPVRPDSLSTNGLNSLALKVNSAVRELTVRRGEATPARLPMDVVFTMVQVYADQPIEMQRTYISRVQALGVPTLSTYVRESKRVYGPSPEQGVPVILGGTSRSLVRELRDLVDELSERLEGISA